MQPRTFLVIPTLFLVACATDPSTPTPVPLPPNAGVHTVYQAPAGTSPFGTSAFVFTGATAPGSATFTDAPVTDENTQPSTYGSGSMNITVDGQAYSSPALETASIVVSDGSQEYLVIGGYEIHTTAGQDRMSQVVVIVPRSDFAVGATVNFDGADRFAMFGEGDPAAQDPDVVAAAVTGSVTFTGGSISAVGTGTVTATLNADFGAIDDVSQPPPSGSGSVTAGSYILTIQHVADVYCDGSLGGQESAFASIQSDDLGFTDGQLAIATGSVTTATGGPIMTAFGALSLELDPAGDGLIAGFNSENTTGPAGTNLAGKYLVLDTNSASPTLVNGSVGAGYVTNTGSCTVSFAATLSAP